MIDDQVRTIWRDLAGPTQAALATAHEEFVRDGVTCVRNVIDPKWIEALRTGVDRAETDPSEFFVDLTDAKGEFGEAAKKRSFWGDFSLWQRFDEFRGFMFDSPLSAIAAAATGSPRVRLFYDYLLVKEPAPGTGTPWHQDYPYYPIVGSDVCSIWVALDRTTLENGGLEYVAGSHKWGGCIDRNSFKGAASEHLTAEEKAEIAAFEATVSDLPDIEAARGDYRIVSWDLNPGDVLIHHCMAVHGAPQNKGTAIRRGYAVRWMYGDLTYAPRATPSRPLLSLIEGGEHPVGKGQVIQGPNFPEFVVD